MLKDKASLNIYRWSVVRRGAMDIVANILRMVYHDDVDWDIALNTIPSSFFEHKVYKAKEEEKTKRRLQLEVLHLININID